MDGYINLEDFQFISILNTHSFKCYAEIYRKIPNKVFYERKESEEKHVNVKKKTKSLLNLFS